VDNRTQPRKGASDIITVHKWVKTFWLTFVLSSLAA
jgi:hypothetical protein